MTSAQAQSSFQSVLSAITSLSPMPPSSSPYSCKQHFQCWSQFSNKRTVSALLDSPAEGEKHTKFSVASPYDCDTDSPSCYDSDSLLNYTSSSHLESIDTLDTSVSWYCRGDSPGHEIEDGGMYMARSGEQTPLSPPPLNSPAPLLDSKVFILRPVQLLDDDYDFTCAGPGEDALEDEDKDESHMADISHGHVQQHRRHRHRDHHQHRHHEPITTQHKSGPRPHLHPHLHKHSRHTPHKESNIPPSNVSQSPIPTIDRTKRRWSAPISPSVDMLNQTTKGVVATGTLDPEHPLFSAGAAPSNFDRHESDVDADVDLRVSPRGRASNKKKLQISYTNDARFQELLSTLLLKIPSGQQERSLSSDTSTPRTWPQRRRSEAPLRLELPDLTNLINDSILHDKRGRSRAKGRSKTLFTFCASNKWGNQPPNGYI